MSGSVRRIISVVGARPNFMKLAPLVRALQSRAMVEHAVVHTGQHYDPEMSADFFRDLGMTPPNENLGVGSGSHAEQTAAVMVKLEPILTARRPELVLVYGDVNSTMAAALVAAKLGIRVGHVEAGLRSGDWSMPEEINRVVTDRVADVLFTPSRDASANLRREGVPDHRIHFVGNVMIDTLVAALPAARACKAAARYRVQDGRYVLVTLHRPSNVDEPDRLRQLMESLETLALDVPVLFPAHPRTLARLEEANGRSTSRVHILGPLPYLDMLSLTTGAAAVVTDSGGLQEETSYLGVPCITVRPNTERPITCTEGTNRLAVTAAAVVSGVREALSSPPRRVTGRIERWDGAASERIACVLCEGARYD
jgi:UDP-N-acetylglucosamine 2-epimerase (non-hydrolysing)